MTTENEKHCRGCLIMSLFQLVKQILFLCFIRWDAITVLTQKNYNFAKTSRRKIIPIYHHLF